MNELARLVDEIHKLRHQTSDEARPEAVKKQHDKGKWTARERVASLLDPESFRELGSLTQAAGLPGDHPADGVIIGVGAVKGRPICCVSYDFTVLGASQGKISHYKTDRIQKIAIEQGYPIVYFCEGGGARVQDLDSLGGSADIFVDLARASGWIPTIGVVVGPAFAGHANIPSLCDFMVMIEGQASMGISGPPLIRAAMGANLSNEEIGGAKIHIGAGTPDLIVPDEQSAIAAIQSYLSYFPSNCEKNPPIHDEVQEPDGDILSLVPTSHQIGYDMKEVMECIFDVNSIFELKPFYGNTVVTALARLGGKPVGVIGNQPIVRAGILDTPASDKIARFISQCDAFNIPLIFLVDAPGFTPLVEEKTGLLRHSARIIYELAQAQVPIFTVVIRKAYGLAFYAMGSKSFEPSFIVAWPTAQFGGMGLEGGMEILHKDKLKSADDPKALRSALATQVGEKLKGIPMAQSFSVDDVIDPRETRSILINGLKNYTQRKVSFPPRRHGIPTT